MESTFDETRTTLLQPDLAQKYLDDLDRLCDRICQSPNDREGIIEAKIAEIEADIPEDPSESEETQIADYAEEVKYLAVLEALLDLIEIGYHLEKSPEDVDGYPPVRLRAPDPERLGNDPQEYKSHEREILQKERRAQFDDRSVRQFIREMETPHRHDGERVDVTDLIVEGDHLYQDLSHLDDLERDEIIEELDTEIQPYVQVAQRGVDDDHTGLDLHDIWRYFRYTWLTPYNSVPGRNINFLVRDAARKRNPVMGIASLASSMMNLKKRDQFIGWRIDAVRDELERKEREIEYEVPLPKEERTPERQTETVTEREWLETEEEYHRRVEEYASMVRNAVEHAIDESIGNVRYDDFVERFDDLTEEDIETASDTAFTRLRQLEGMARYVFKEYPPLVDDVDNPEEHENVFDPEEYDLDRSQLQDLDIKDDDPEDLDDWEEKSETALFVKKRARNLQKLLRDKEFFVGREELDDRTFLQEALASEAGERALQTALKEIKKRRVGAGMMNIQVCGAIPPYNHILGGKLVAMALTGPAVIDSYRDKYEGYTSRIASAMNGGAVVKNNQLVFLDTTGLFKYGSAQYDRVRVPASNSQIEYEEIGQTEGYGSVQFGPSARKRLSQVTALMENRKAVKDRFGEGVAPKMRKIRRGLENLKLDGELLRHESPRVIYAVPLADNFREFLFGLDDDPDYYWSFEDIESEQQTIYDHWKSRWVSKRVQKEWVLEDIKSFDKEKDLQLGYEVDFENHSLEEF